MRFVKMHGIGNDYVYVDCFNQPAPADPAGLSRVVSDRHFGIGSDGLILLCPSDRADARMRMFNADGSESEMCGNGARSAARFVNDHGPAQKPGLPGGTGRGILTLQLEVEAGKVRRVRVDMGEPIFLSKEIPTLLPGDPPRDFGFEVDGQPLKVTCVSMGNPHCVVFVDEITDAQVLGLGPKIEKSALFPRRTNVEFVRVNRPDDVTMRVWERGSGETLACGTGACAVAVAGVLTGRSQRRGGAPLPRGGLHLHWSQTGNHGYINRPGVGVVRGEGAGWGAFP